MVLREVESSQQPVIVTRDGEEIAKLLPLNAAEKRWRSWVRDLGGDPDDPAWRRPDTARPRPSRRGEKSLSEHLADQRADER